MAAVCATPVFAVARRTATVTRARSGQGEAAKAPMTRRNVVLSVPALLAASAAAPAKAAAPAAYYDDTMEVISLTKSIISGEDLSEANFAKFQEKRDIWQGRLETGNTGGAIGPPPVSPHAPVIVSIHSFLHAAVRHNFV